MRVLLAVGLLCAAPAWAETPADRTAIEQVINSLNTAKSVAVLFTADADSQLDLLKQPAGEIWSEVFHPTTGRLYVAIRSIRFLTPEIALVDAAGTQFGSTIPMRRVPVWLVMKKEGAEWKIASLRVPDASDFV